MARIFAVAALLAATVFLFADRAQAWPWRHQQYYQQQYNQPAAAPQAGAPAPAAQLSTVAQQAAAGQRAPVAARPWPAPAQPHYSYGGMATGAAWPVYPNYGNPVGAAYSPAAGLRQGQFFGTFGLRPADARARGAY